MNFSDTMKKLRLEAEKTMPTNGAVFKQNKQRNLKSAFLNTGLAATAVSLSAIFGGAAYDSHQSLKSVQSGLNEFAYIEQGNSFFTSLGSLGDVIPNLSQNMASFPTVTAISAGLAVIGLAATACSQFMKEHPSGDELSKDFGGTSPNAPSDLKQPSLADYVAAAKRMVAENLRGFVNDVGHKLVAASEAKQAMGRQERPLYDGVYRNKEAERNDAHDAPVAALPSFSPKM